MTQWCTFNISQTFPLTLQCNTIVIRSEPLRFLVFGSACGGYVSGNGVFIFSQFHFFNLPFKRSVTLMQISFCRPLPFHDQSILGNVAFPCSDVKKVMRSSTSGGSTDDRAVEASGPAGACWRFAILAEPKRSCGSCSGSDLV